MASAAGTSEAAVPKDLSRAGEQAETALMRAVLRRVPAVSGARLSDEGTETPALVFDADAVEHNCARLREVMTPFEGAVSARPHVKSHKCPALARRQLELSGGTCKGICAQKVCEAEAMAAGGVRDILLSNQVVSAPKLARLAALAASGCAVSVLVDDADQVRFASAAASSAHTTLGVLVEVDVGQRRCGVATVPEAVALAKLATAMPGLEFRGVQCYHGAAQHIRDYEERKAAIDGVAGIARACVAQLTAAGLPCATVTGGGSGTFEFEAASGAFTEVQPGSSVVWDRDYSDNLGPDGKRVGETGFRHALQVLATVISRTTALPNPRVVLDCGLKCMSGESGLPALLRVLSGKSEAASGAAAASTTQPPLKVVGLSDEHTQIELDLDDPRVVAAVAASGGGGDAVAAVADEMLPKVRDRVLLAPGHCDPTCNLHDFALWARGDVVEEVMEISARSPGL
ncbi:hypothetical protein FNF29_08449 [Cafeteria roenbergensis]|uniref:D-serine dehydratase-like domain-containing protein n=1 Tax=Cafeteria roenbergensis TaxID=33653 RepID=A0A5A8BY67_CAFRO|nr:hypothetical protein FNF29_08449 [Cafeteria roenbergensis]|eukprot:KAA0145643.1 hypothetical protein FNF29_08449 [Cafeteria roenbergensis]